VSLASGLAGSAPANLSLDGDRCLNSQWGADRWR